MSDPVNPPRPSIWREAFAASARAFEYLLPWVIGAAAIQGLAMHQHIAHMMELMQHAQNIGGDPAVATLPSMGVASVMSLLVALVAMYCYVIVYLRREPIARMPEASFDTFLYWLGQELMKLFIIFAIVLVGVILGAGGTMVSGNPKPLFFIAGGIVSLCGVWFIIVRYLLVYPLAISLVKPALENSWILTQGNFWRLNWQYFVFMFPIVLVMIFGVIVAILLAVALHVSFESPAVLWAISTVAGLCQALMGMVSTMFFCAACRILYNEELLRDPEFPGVAS